MKAEIRLQVVCTGKELLGHGLVPGTWGNVSARDGTEVAITPSGMDYRTLIPEDIAVCSLDGKVVSGCRRPSTELPLHLAIYQAREDIRAVVHTHSPYACAAAVARRSIPPILEDMIQIMGGEIKVAAYAPPGSEALAANAVDALGDRMGMLLANHGAVAVGRNLNEALLISLMIERAAKVFALAGQLGAPAVIDPDDAACLRRFYLERYGQKG